MSPAAITPKRFVTFGELLKYLRRQARITQVELALAVGYSDAQISRMEQNQRIPDSATVTALFVPALEIEQKPEWVERLLELAKAASANDVIEHAEKSQASDRSTTSHNLPLELTSFIGHEKEIDKILQLFETHRLITIIGSGGMGKTRLSLQVANQLLSSFPHGVWLVEFASFSDPALVPLSLANLFGLRSLGGSKSSILEKITDFFSSPKSVAAI